MTGKSRRWRSLERPSLSAVLVLLFLGFGFGATHALAQPTTQPPPAALAPEDLRALAHLLGKPEIQAWLRANPSSAAPRTSPEPESATQSIGTFLNAARSSLKRLAAAVPKLPEQLDIVWMTLVHELREHGLLGLLGPLAAFALFGTACEALFRRATVGVRRRIAELPLETVDNRLRAICWRTFYGVGIIGAFAAGSVGAFLVFDWPPLLEQIMLTYLIVVLAVRLSMVGGRIVFAPGAERFRMLPMSNRTARYWFLWSATLVGVFYFAKGTFRLIPVLGANLDSRTLVGTVLSVLMLALTLVALWRRPSNDGTMGRHRARDGWTWLITIYLSGVWLTVFTGETEPFDIGILVMLILLANHVLRLAVEHVLRSAEGGPTSAVRPFAVIAFHRGTRIVMIAGGVLVVAYILNLDLTDLASNDAVATRIARSVLDIVIIVLVADLIWQLARVWIDHHLNETMPRDAGTEAEARRRHRLRTLLPVLRHILLVTVVAIAGVTALSTIGVAVGPLVAGAGVVGIAIGFGAQTLVKDIISGMFFLFDDAFRVGEYIESGSIKGTVEGFSLRSIKLRHQRGALHTVPFGALSTITNYSRDWVIDKISIGVTYDTDLSAVKRIVKEIGKALKEDPEFAPQILETLKMQGIDDFGDFAIRIKLKITTRPGEQFLIRRRAYTLMKSAFDKEGIKFAYPTVTVAPDAAAIASQASAVAKTTLDLARPEPAR